MCLYFKFKNLIMWNIDIVSVNEFDYMFNFLNGNLLVLTILNRQNISANTNGIRAIETFSPGGMEIDLDRILAFNLNFVENSVLVFEETHINTLDNNIDPNLIDNLIDEFETIDLNDESENIDNEFENYISDEDFTFDRYEWTSSDYTYDDTDWHYNSS